MQVSTANDVKVYNLSAGKSLPEWISDRKKRTLLKNDVGLRQRIELIQDFSMPVASSHVKVSGDGQYIFAAGVYKPRVRCYDVHHLSMKFERCVDAETVDMNILSDDYTKFGFYYRTRVPRFGRSLAYHSSSCDLYVAAEGPEVYRLNLAQGQFMPPLKTRASGSSVCEFNQQHQLFTVGTEDGTVECWDPRSLSRVGELSLASADIQFSDSRDTCPAVTALKYRDGINFAVGTSTGQVLLYDLRSPRPYRVKDHLYSSPIHSISFQTSERLVLSADSKILKIWNENNGSAYTSIEPEHGINQVHHQPGSGLVMMAVEDPKMLAYYVPTIGPAPRWCSFLDNLTEELEEDPEPVVYEDYKFVTAQNLEELGLSHLVGTNLLQAYMHGYFMDMRFYHKARAIAEPFAYEEYRKEKIKKKIEEARATRIRLKGLPKVNRQLAEKLLEDSSNPKKKKKKRKTQQQDGSSDAVDEPVVAGEVDVSNPLGDQRFAALFQNTDFEVDPESEAYQRLHPILSHREKRLNKKEKILEDAYPEEDDEVEGRPSDAGSSSDESDHEVWAEIRRERREKRREEQAKSVPATTKAPPTVTMTAGALKPENLSKKATKTSLGQRLDREVSDLVLSSKGSTLGSKEHTFSMKKESKEEEDRKQSLREHKYERRKVRRSASSVLPKQKSGKVYWRGKRVK